MDSLKDISSETIRKNWNEYKNIIGIGDIK